MKQLHILLFSSILFFAACGDDDEIILPDSCPTGQEDTHIAMGNPDGATTNANSPDKYLIQLPEFAVSYNRDRGIPNWVSWHLSTDWTGDADRQDDFRPFPELPSGWYQVDESDYTNSGFDRGHNCPSADRTCSESGNSATFYMTNMVPQAPTHNRNLWRLMEEFTRSQIEDGNEVYVIMGNYGVGGTGSNGYAETIGNGVVTVPKSIWKVLLILPEGSFDVARVVDDTRVVAVDMPNDNDALANKDWFEFVTSVDSIEARSGMDLFSELPFALQGTIEAVVDDGPF